MDIDLLVETKRLPVLHEAFEHRVVDTLCTHLGVRMTEEAEVGDPGLFEVQR